MWRGRGGGRSVGSTVMLHFFKSAAACPCSTYRTGEKKTQNGHHCFFPLTNAVYSASDCFDLSFFHHLGTASTLCTSASSRETKFSVANHCWMPKSHPFISSSLNARNTKLATWPHRIQNEQGEMVRIELRNESETQRMKERGFFLLFT